MARNFAGSDYLTVTDTGLPSGDAAFTLAHWLRTSTSADMITQSYGTNAMDQQIYLGVYDIGSGQKRVIAGNAAVNIQGDASIIDGNWHHVAVTHDGTTLRLYVDGVEEDSAAATMNLVLGGTYRLGSDFSASPGQFYTGDLAEAAVWSTNLSGDEIAALARGVSTRRVRPESLVRYNPVWGIQSPEPDLTANSNDLTVTGTTPANHAPVVPFSRWLWGTAPEAASGGTTNNQGLTGTLSLSATLAKQAQQSKAATLSVAGGLTKIAAKGLAGALSLAGACGKAAAKGMTATTALAGGLAKLASKSLTATFALAGSFAATTVLSLVLSATLSLGGSLVRQANKGLSGPLTLAGTLAKFVAKGLAATLGLAGALAKAVAKVQSAALGLSGNWSSSLGAPTTVPWRVEEAACYLGGAEEAACYLGGAEEAVIGDL